MFSPPGLYRQPAGKQGRPRQRAANQGALVVQGTPETFSVSVTTSLSHPANQGAAAWQGTPGTFSGSVAHQIKPSQVQVQVENMWIVIIQLILYSTLDLLDPIVLLFAKELT